MTHLHTKMVPRTLLFLISLFAIVPQSANALVVQGVIGVSIFNTFMVIVMFLILPVAGISMLARLFGARKTKNNNWVFDIKVATLHGIRYASYHLVLIGGWIILLDLQQITFTGTSRYAPDFAHEQVWQLVLYTILFATIVPWSLHYIQKLFGYKMHPPTYSNVIRLFIWNMIVFFVIYQFIVPSFY